MSATANPFAALLNGAASAKHNAPGDDADSDPVIQRTVPAADAPPVNTTAPNSPFNWRPAGSAAAPAPPAAEPTPERAPMASKKPKAPKARKAKPTQGASPQFQICSLLAAKGSMTREALATDVTCDERPFGNAMYNARVAGRIEHNAKTDQWQLTKAGREWLTGGANLDNVKAASAPPQAQRKAPASKAARASVPAGQLVEVRVASTFRCAVYSDGAFTLAKDGTQIDLTAAEHADMLRYLERMAEEQA